MHDETTRSDRLKAYEEIEELVGESPVEQVVALYAVASWFVRQDIAVAVMVHIGKGNTELKKGFKEFYKLGVKLPA